jgi:hypothetical protein
MNPNSEKDIVPFGKYRDQPVEAMLADQNYVQWVMSQPGLVTMIQGRYPALFNIITVGSPTTEDTPEHNKLQAMFLSKSFQDAFIERAIGKSPYAISAELAQEVNDAAAKRLKASIELAQRDVAISLEKLKEAQKENALTATEDAYEHYRKERTEHATLEKARYNRETAEKAKKLWSQQSEVLPIKEFSEFADWIENDGGYSNWPSTVRRRRETLTKAEKRVIDDQVLYLGISSSTPIIAIATRPTFTIEFECQYDLDFQVDWYLENKGVWGEKHREYKGEYSEYRSRDWEQYSIEMERKMHFRIELKPQMGDDFPAVLRQMKRSNADTLVVGSYDSSSCTLDEVREIFGAKRIITLDEIKSIQSH